MNKKMMNYQGKKIYVGMDVHKKTYAVTVRYQKEIMRRDTLKADPEGLVQYLRKYFKGAQIFSAYEAGFSGFRLHHVLCESGIKNSVINPASIEVAANDKVKNDKRDSNKISEQLSDGRLHGIHIPDQAQELRRTLTRTREQVVKHRARVAIQIKSKLHYFGLIGAEEKNFPVSNNYLKRLTHLKLPSELEFALNLLADQWRFLTLQLVKIRKRLHEQAQEDDKLETVYQSVPGVGPISARVFANELGDLAKRFSNERELFKYTGLTPCEYSSGESVHRGHISRQGSPRVRHLLVEVAWRAITIDGALKDAFNRIAATRGKKRAIVAIARKIIGRIRACFRTEKLYALGLCK